MGMTHFLIFGFGGGLGAICRAYLSRIVDSLFPWATLIVNVVGSALVGILMAFFAQSHSFAAMDEELLANGFCGGFTTFSSFSYQTMTLFRDGKSLHGLLNIVLNLVFALGGVWGGRRYVMDWGQGYSLVMLALLKEPRLDFTPHTTPHHNMVQSIWSLSACGHAQAGIYSGLTRHRRTSPKKNWICKVLIS